MKRNIKKKTSKKSTPNNSGLLLVLGILLIAVVAIWVSGCNNKSARQAGSVADAANDFNVEVGIPQDNIGDLDKVPKEELDSLFANLK
jgi:hypothetical protein